MIKIDTCSNKVRLDGADNPNPDYKRSFKRSDPAPAYLI